MLYRMYHNYGDECFIRLYKNHALDFEGLSHILVTILISNFWMRHEELNRLSFQKLTTKIYLGIKILAL